MQMPVVRIGRQHGGVIAAEAGVEQQPAVVIADGFHVGYGQQAQQRVAEVAALELCRIVFELFEQYRHEIDHGTDLRMALQVRGHVAVVLQAVQIGPGQHEVAVAVIAVIRLVHVPEEDEVEFG
jgi:hypothetical protein